MPEIWFYHLQHQPLERALPSLLEKALERGWRVVVQATADERLDALDDLLWTYAEASFLAHGRARDGDAEMQPVYLTTGSENPNGARLRLFVDGADVEALIANDAGAYERLILLFDGGDDEQLTRARAQWKTLKEQGHTLAYWQQGERGGWEKRA
ncbi:MAG TPA: DNA polymerase III subunit chi [Methylovirgula sp.]